MTPLLDRKEIEQTKSLAEAVYLLFGWDLAPRGIHHIFNLEFEERVCLFKDEAMEGEIARAYDKLGRTTRKDTYRKIVKDFQARVHYPLDAQKNILDAGCGSGLLSLELSDQLKSTVIGLDLSAEMVVLAEKNLEKVVASSERKINFIQGSVYDLDKIITEKVDYIICRNVLHRFRNPPLAIKKMYDALQMKGQIYFRDLRRDADWHTIIERIGEARWKHPALVRDYIGAMAQMFTIAELRKLLLDSGITSFEITDGSYASSRKITPPQTMNEYASPVEYVGVIRKR